MLPQSTFGVGRHRSHISVALMGAENSPTGKPGSNSQWRRRRGQSHCWNIPRVLGMAMKATLFSCCDLLGRSQMKVVEDTDGQQEVGL